MAGKGRRLRRWGALLLLLALAVAGYGYIREQPSVVEDVLTRLGWQRRATPTNIIYASGTIEADQVQAMSLVPGRVITVTVDEGDSVRKGDVLVRLDDSLLQKQLAAAQAQIALAEAQLALLQAGPRPEEIAQAQAQVEAARVAVEVAQLAVEDAQSVRDAAQDLQPELIKAETEVEKARYQRDAALALAQAADLTTQLWEKINNQVKGGVDIPLPDGSVRHVPPPQDKLNEVSYQWNLASQKAWEAWAQYRQADAALAAARTRLETVRAQLDDPARDAPVAQAEGELEKAKGKVAVAEAGLHALQEGVNEERIEAARARVDQARAEYRRLLAQRAYYTITAPEGGRILQRAIEPGEVAMPGVPLFDIGNLRRLRLVLYIPEDQLGRVRLGESVTIHVDAYPNRTFTGTVVHIAQEAEFTPKNVQTKEDRQILVYAVEVEIPNEDGLLKPGMPADAEIHVP